MATEVDPEAVIAESRRNMKSAAKVRSVRERSARFRRTSGMRAAAHPGVLLIEDDPLSQASTFRCLQAYLALDFAIANGLGSARRSVGEIPWDLIVVDLNLAGEGGEEFVHELILSGYCGTVVVRTGLVESAARERLGDDADRVIFSEKGSGADFAEWIAGLARESRAKALAR